MKRYDVIVYTTVLGQSVDYRESATGRHYSADKVDAMLRRIIRKWKHSVAATGYGRDAHYVKTGVQFCINDLEEAIEESE